jgi:membrane protease YdiL (CAAX protease family)
VLVLTAAYFARTETIQSGLTAFGLDRKPTERVWIGIAAALILRVFSHLALKYHWTNGVHNFAISAFRNTGGVERYLYLLSPLVYAPMFEEVVNRGFLYKAFRVSYSPALSTAIIIAWTAWTHLSQYERSGGAVFTLTVLTVVQCFLREKSDSLRDCIICHFTFNAIPLLWPNSSH